MIESILLVVLFSASGVDIEDLAEIRIPDGAVSEDFDTRPRSALGKRTVYTLGKEKVGEEHYWRNGGLAEIATYRDGKEHGIRRQFYDNGAKFSERPYRHGLLDGVVRFWDEQGQLIGTSELKAGTGDLTEFELDGLSAHLSESHYVNGELDGIKVVWGRYDGCRGLGYSVSTYRKDKVYGRFEIRDDDGVLLSSQSDKDNASHGVHHQYDREGNRIEGFPKFYIKNKKVSESAIKDAAKFDKFLAESLDHKPVMKEKPRQPPRRLTDPPKEKAE